MKRGYYGEMIFETGDETVKVTVTELVKRIVRAEKVDEHGSWDFGAEFDGKGRGTALNWDTYAVGNDAHTGQFLAVIQVRQWQKTRRRGFASVRKNYFLIGENEDGTVFAHAVSANVIHRAIKDGRDVVLAVQNWIFGGDYAAMQRHGDLAIIPMNARPAGTRGARQRREVLAGSHELKATQIADVDGRIYAKDLTLTHVPGTHPTVTARGWHRVVVGRRADFWKFAAPTVD